MKKENENLEIKCPKCGTPIPVSEALQHQLTQHIREELEEKVGQREKEILLQEKTLKEKEKRLGEVERETEKRVVKEVAAAVATREAELKKREVDIAVEKKSIDKRVQEVIGPRGGKTGEEITGVKGKTLPPTPKAGSSYKLVDATKH